jgi:AcrR family transcriptional regulator
MAQAGRRPGVDSTREAVLEAARKSFASKGFQATTVRAVAADAGVSPSMIHHFFATKDALFLAAIRMPIDPDVIVARVLDGPRKQLPERLVRTFVTTWHAPATGPALRSVVRAAVADQEQAAGLRAFAEHVMLPRVTQALDLPPLQITAAISLLLGYIFAGQLIGIEPLASADVDELVALFTPAVARLLAAPHSRTAG